MKVFVTLFFGAIGVVALSILSAIGGLAGGGVSLLANELTSNLLLSSFIGATFAAFVFHGVVKGLDKFFITVAKKEAADDPTGSRPKPPSLASDPKHLWGSVSYFVSTLIGVNLFGTLITDPQWAIIATIVGSGLLGLIGLAAIFGLNLWRPKLKDSQR